jgi:hypothetical protein
MTIFLKKINLSEKNGFCTETCRWYSTGFQESHSEKGRGYVWHCHIIDHEDNEMMRPYKFYSHVPW